MIRNVSQTKSSLFRGFNQVLFLLNELKAVDGLKMGHIREKNNDNSFIKSYHDFKFKPYE